MATIHAVSHVDHSLTPSQVELVKTAIAPLRGFNILTLQVPEGQLECGLHGPAMGDAPVPESEVSYEVRGDRKGASRMCDRPSRKTSQLTVIVGTELGIGDILFTCFGGPVAPREPHDPDIAGNVEEIEKSRLFWSQHALSK